MVDDDDSLRSRITALEVRETACEKLNEERARRLTDRIDAVAQSLAAALNSAEVAVSKANTAMDKRLDALNEFRQMMMDTEAHYMRRTEILPLLKTLEDRVNGLADLVHAQVQRGTGIREVWGFIVGLGGIGVGLLTVIWMHK